MIRNSTTQASSPPPIQSQSRRFGCSGSGPALDMRHSGCVAGNSLGSRGGMDSNDGNGSDETSTGTKAGTGGGTAIRGTAASINGAPHSLQNFAPARFSAPQAGHTMCVSPGLTSHSYSGQGYRIDVATMLLAAAVPTLVASPTR